MMAMLQHGYTYDLTVRSNKIAHQLGDSISRYGFVSWGCTVSSRPEQYWLDRPTC